jgi:O-methyltransferase
MNASRLLSPDFALGKGLLLGRAVLGTAGLLVRRPSARSWRVARLILGVTPGYTMVSPARLRQLYELVREADARGLPGDLVECGTWNGGSAAVMAAACRDDGWLSRRTFWLFDSFEGLPPPGEQDGARERREFYAGWCKGDPRKVREILSRIPVPAPQIKIVPGWFDATLPAAPIRTIAVLHVDVDWHDSVTRVLETLYDKVVPGGFIVFDDYGKWPGCRRAVDRFLGARGMSRAALTRATHDSAYVRKEGSDA